MLSLWSSALFPLVFSRVVHTWLAHRFASAAYLRLGEHGFQEISQGWSVSRSCFSFRSRTLVGCSSSVWPSTDEECGRVPCAFRLLTKKGKTVPVERSCFLFIAVCEGYTLAGLSLWPHRVTVPLSWLYRYMEYVPASFSSRICRERRAKPPGLGRFGKNSP